MIWFAERWLGTARAARVEVFAADDIAIVHVMNRTVRRCFLMGDDAFSGKNFEWGQNGVGTKRGQVQFIELIGNALAGVAKLDLSPFLPVILLDILDELGREIADRLIIESHFQLDGFTTFPRCARAIIDADTNLNSGANVASLTTVCRRRRIRLA